MAKKPTKAKKISVTHAELKKMPRSQQRRYLDLGYVKDEPPPAKAEAKADAKPKAAA